MDRQVVGRRVDRQGVLTAHMVHTGRMVHTARVAALMAHTARTVPAVAVLGDRMDPAAAARAVLTARTAAQAAR